MAAGQSGAVLRDIETLFGTGTASGISDRQLLERFASGRDASAEAAFEVLVRRHGPMVLRVCRNVLRNSTDAEDAFQATFLVLVRRRRSIRRLESVGGWLNGVAFRVAARARVVAARRRTVEQHAGLRIVAAADPSEGDESGVIVQEEVRRLPAKYRDVVVLCYWEGLTQEQAAAQLGCPLGTVRSRLARARDLLHRRLTRRGLAPLAAVTAAALDRGAQTACASQVGLRVSAIPPQLVHSTIRAAVQTAAGKATAPVAAGLVATLVEQTLWSMTMTKISAWVAGLALLGFVGYGAGVAVSKGQLAQGKKNADGKKKSTPRPDGRPNSATYMMVTSNIEGETAILTIVPNGSTVKKGAVVCELDSAGLKDSLTNQQITVKAAEANFKNAKLEREAAETDVTDYAGDLFPREQREAEGELKVAEAELEFAEEQLKHHKDYGSPQDRERKERELAVARAKLAKEKAANRLHLLEHYTKRKRTTELRDRLVSARSNELAKGAVWELERNRERKLERQIAACTVKAARDGTLVYAYAQIEEGTVVRQHQPLFQIVSGGRGEGGED